MNSDKFNIILISGNSHINAPVTAFRYYSPAEIGRAYSQRLERDLTRNEIEVLCQRPLYYEG